MSEVDLRFGDCLAILRELPDESIDAVITDPPYGLADHKPDAVVSALTAWASGDRERVPSAKGGFMGREWDSFVPPPAVWDECLRVLKPGGHLVAFSGSRTYDLMGLSIRMAGFEIRDGLQWLQGAGMPKGLNVGKAIDKMRDDRADILRVTTYLADHADARGVTRAQVDKHMGTSDMGGWWLSRLQHRCQVPRWEQWERLRDLLGFGDEMDAEVWRLNGRKGTPGNEREILGVRSTRTANKLYGDGAGTSTVTFDTAPVLAEAAQWEGWNTSLAPGHEPIVLARKPLAGTVARTVLDHGTGAINVEASKTDEGRWPKNVVIDEHVAADLGGRARYFYCAKAPASERPRIDGKGWPTVKPLALMRWIVRLVTPPGGLVLDPFAGTSSTLQAARDEGFASIGIERDEFAYRLGCKRFGLPDPGEGFSTALTPVTALPEATPIDPVLALIAEAESREELIAVWRENKQEWTDAHTAAAEVRKSEIGVAA